MGEAKRRGSKQERVQQARQRNAAALEQARLQHIAAQKELDDRLDAMSPEQRAAHARTQRRRLKPMQVLAIAAMLGAVQ